MHRYIFFLCFVSCAYSECTFPTELRGQWRSTSNGVLTFTNTTMSNYAASFTSITLNFTCTNISGSNYVVRSQQYDLFLNIRVYAYLCMQFEMLSSKKYLYTLGTTRDSTVGTRHYLSTASSENVSKICSMTDTRTAGEYELLVLSNSTQSAAVTCPTITQSYFTVVISKYSNFSTKCENTTMEGRGNSSTAVTFNYSSCADTNLVFSSGGKFFCMYSLVSGDYTYLNLWNSDSSTNGANTFTFTCMVLSKSEATVSATESPKACQYQQTPTYVDSTGRYYSLTDTLYTDQRTSENLAWVALLVVFGSLAVIGVIVAILINIFCIKKPPPITPPPSPLPIVKKKRKKIKKKEWNLVKIPSRKGRSKRSGVRTYTASVSKSRRSQFSFSRYDLDFIREYSVGKRNRPPEYDTHSKASSQPPKWQVMWETELKPSPRSEKSNEISPPMDVQISQAPTDTIHANPYTASNRHVSFVEKPPDPPSRSDTILDDIGWLQSNERKNEPIYDQANKMWPMLAKRNSKIWYINVDEKETNPKS